ncbi:MAG: cation diffusion facilitator family transporter, partial [Elusimicrobiota bacterium]
MGGHHHALERQSRSLVIQSMLLAAGLAALKIAAGLMANSVALLASALDSLMDLFTSGLNFVSLKFSQEPADADHPYGHGKIEAIAGSVQGLVIGVSGLALLVESIRRVVNAEPVAA